MIDRRAFFGVFLLPIMAASPLWQAGESGIVKEVIDGDSLVLESGLVVRLAQIEAPRLREDDPMSQKARDYLIGLLLGKKVNLKYGGLRRDKMGRALAQVYLNEGIWVQGELLKNGFARVHTYIDNRSHVEDFWFAEREARRNGRGVWTDPKFQARFATPDALIGSEGSFQLVEGKIAKIIRTETLIKLCFGEDETSDVCAIIPKHSWKLFVKLWGDNDLDTFKGLNIRVRGRINGTQPARITKNGRALPAHGPSIWLDHPEQVEFLIT